VPLHLRGEVRAGDVEGDQIAGLHIDAVDLLVE
jgi:hypothetical protein